MLSAKQSSRRKFLLSSLIALPALGVTVKDLSAALAAEMIAPSLESYSPTFFSRSEWTFLLAACDRLIPADGRGPGALETNVPIFIDQQLAAGLGSEVYLQGPFEPQAPATLGYQLPYTLQEIFQKGISAVEHASLMNYGHPFALLSLGAQEQTLHRLQAGEIDFAEHGEPLMSSTLFFNELLNLTRQGWLADPIYGGNKGMKAWVAIGFPGARASYLEWVAQHEVVYPLGPVSLTGERA